LYFRKAYSKTHVYKRFKKSKNKIRSNNDAENQIVLCTDK
jgi:hypothetical protein